MNLGRYFIESVEEELLTLVDTVFVGPAGDPRSAELPRRWSGRFFGAAYCLSYEMRGQRCGLQEISIGDVVARQQSAPTADITQLYRMLERLELDGKTILVDFTGMEQPAIFFLFKCLRDQRSARRVFGLYTEPLRYRTRPGSSPEEAFDLTEEFIDFQALPGFVRRHDPGRRRQLLVYMGFEGRRFTKVLEEVDHDPRYVHAVFGIPAFQPGWQYLTLGSNQAALERSRAELHAAEANNVFDAYEVAEKIGRTYTDYQLVMAPIGTKPHAVGSGIYASLHEDSLLIYDFPIKQALFRTEGVGKASVYNLSELILG